MEKQSNRGQLRVKGWGLFIRQDQVWGTTESSLKRVGAEREAAACVKKPRCKHKALKSFAALLFFFVGQSFFYINKKSKIA